MARPGGRLLRAVGVGGGTYFRIAGNQRSAAISYHVLFSLVPFVALLVSVLELVLPQTTEQRVVAWLVGVLPLPEDLQGSVEEAVSSADPPATAAGVIALVGLIWAASGMMTSIRSAFRAIWASEADRPYLRGKALDVVLVLGAGLLVVCGFGMTVVVQVVTETSTNIVRDLGGDGNAAQRIGSLGQLVGSTLLVFVAFALLYRVVPPVATRVRDVWPGALVAAVGFQVASAGFSIYLDRFASFDDVYGPLGAILAFLVLVYIAAGILIVGACVVAAWPSTLEPRPAQPSEPVPLRARLVRAARGLAVRDGSPR
jgi:YihY family inner membrane protein